LLVPLVNLTLRLLSLSKAILIILAIKVDKILSNLSSCYFNLSSYYKDYYILNSIWLFGFFISWTTIYKNNLLFSKFFSKSWVFWFMYCSLSLLNQFLIIKTQPTLQVYRTARIKATFQNHHLQFLRKYSYEFGNWHVLYLIKTLKFE
jgi:hypothetical protein